MAGGQPSDATDDEGGAEGEIDESTPDQLADAASGDGRAARPEPLEHIVGAQAHPAKAAASDPAAAPVGPPAPVAAPSESSEPEQPQADPAATPEP